MDDFLSEEFKKLNCVGLGIAYSVGQEIYSYCFGKSNLDYNIDILEDSVFNLASIGKLFTVIAVFQQIEQNKFTLETEIKDILEDLPDFFRKVKIKHLLTHSSGIKSYTSVDDYWKEARLDVPRERILEYIKDSSLDFEPGSNWSYNNSGFYLLGLIVEKTSRQSYFEYIKREILTPLGLKYIYPTDAYDIISNRVTGYQKNNGLIRVAEYYSNAGLFSAGGFSAKLSDFLRFEKAVFEKKIINQKSLKTFLTPFLLNNGKTVKEEFPHYGFEMCHGIYKFNHKSETIYAHNGEIIGFSCDYFRAVNDDFSVIAVCNTQDRNAIHNFLLRFYDEWKANR